MGSILEALKKLEKEAPKQEEAQPWSEIDMKRTIRQRVKGRLFLNRFLPVLLVIAILSFGGWFVLGGEFLLPKSPQSPDAPTAPTAYRQVKEAPTSVKKKPPEPKGHAPKARAEEKRAQSPSQTEASEPILPEEEKVVLTKVKEPEAPELKTGEPPVVKRPFPDRQFEQSRFKLEAIIWSDDPGGRFAVINGHIVRAGESLEGASVYHIGKDYVTFGSGDREWRLKFKNE